MTTITKNDIALAIQQKKMHISRNFMPKNLSWSDIGEIYNLDKNVIYISWASFQAQEKEIIFGYYKHVLDSIGEIYKGYPLFGMVIVHLVSRNNNTVSDPDFLSLSNKFFENNPKKIPEHMIIRDHGLDGDSWDSTVHFDKENRVYVQGGGQTLWKLFDDSHNLTDAIILNPGDLVFIPKGLVHSVESLGPRHSLSIALSDEPVI
jgi:mannose-6-phosphate isomerase-like protein (cupin superfamily)